MVDILDFSNPQSVLLRETIHRLGGSPISSIVADRLGSFAEIQSMGFSDWFPELCFCILVANSPARKILRAIESIEPECLLRSSEEDLRRRLKMSGVRFHNRASFIVEARKFTDLKDRVLRYRKSTDAREWLAGNIRGLGYKEASHFLRNVGFLDLAILDRHVVHVLISTISVPGAGMPKSRNQYLEMEELYLRFSGFVGLRPGELDLYLWYLSTGDIVK